MKPLSLFGIALLPLLAIASIDAQEKVGPKPDRTALVQGNNQFAFDLYRRLARQEGNIVFSPYSISSALAMTYAGARGETAEQMALVLHFGVHQDRLHPTFRDLISDLQVKDKGRCYDLHVANSIWGQKDFSFADGFIRLIHDNYRAAFRAVDFQRDIEGARHAINGWVEEQTEKKIQDFLKQGDLNATTRLVLANAIYFKGAWRTPFPKERTKDAAFELSPGKRILVPTMHVAEGLFNYCKQDDFEMLELPYKGDQVSLLVLSPLKKGHLPNLERNLTPANLHKAVKKLSLHLGSVQLPRFQVAADCRLVGELSDLGMPLAFSGSADFSGIATGAELRISNVVHKALIDVDEHGTVAAASTAVVIGDTDPLPFTFRADHPFVFLVLDKRTDTILFFGRVTNPR